MEVARCAERSTGGPSQPTGQGPPMHPKSPPPPRHRALEVGGLRGHEAERHRVVLSKGSGPVLERPSPFGAPPPGARRRPPTSAEPPPRPLLGTRARRAGAGHGRHRSPLGSLPGSGNMPEAGPNLSSPHPARSSRSRRWRDTATWWATCMPPSARTAACLHAAASVYSR